MSCRMLEHTELLGLATYFMNNKYEDIMDFVRKPKTSRELAAILFNWNALAYCTRYSDANVLAEIGEMPDWDTVPVFEYDDDAAYAILGDYLYQCCEDTVYEALFIRALRELDTILGTKLGKNIY